MSTGPQGQKRPRDVIGCTVHVMKIAPEEIEENLEGAPRRQPGRARSGKVGGRARADSWSAITKAALTRHRVHDQKSRRPARRRVLTGPHPRHVSTFCSFRCPDLQLRAVEANLVQLPV